MTPSRCAGGVAEAGREVAVIVPSQTVYIGYGRTSSVQLSDFLPAPNTNVALTYPLNRRFCTLPPTVATVCMHLGKPHVLRIRVWVMHPIVRVNGRPILRRGASVALHDGYTLEVGTGQHRILWMVQTSSLKDSTASALATLVWPPQWRTPARRAQGEGRRGPYLRRHHASTKWGNKTASGGRRLRTANLKSMNVEDMSVASFHKYMRALRAATTSEGGGSLYSSDGIDADTDAAEGPRWQSMCASAVVVDDVDMKADSSSEEELCYQNNETRLMDLVRAIRVGGEEPLQLPQMPTHPLHVSALETIEVLRRHYRHAALVDHEPLPATYCGSKSSAFFTPMSNATKELLLHHLHAHVRALRSSGCLRPAVLHLQTPLLCCGNLHGRFSELWQVLVETARCGEEIRERVSSATSTLRLLVLGNHVDEGPCGVEVVMMLFALAVWMPDAVHLVRGSQEDAAENGNEPFFNDLCLKEQCTYFCGSLFGADAAERGDVMWEEMNEVLVELPLAAVVDDQPFAASAGWLPPSWLKLRHRGSTALIKDRGGVAMDEDEEEDEEDGAELLAQLYRCVGALHPFQFDGLRAACNPDLMPPAERRRAFAYSIVWGKFQRGRQPAASVEEEMHLLGGDLVGVRVDAQRRPAETREAPGVVAVHITCCAPSNDEESTPTRAISTACLLLATEVRVFQWTSIVPILRPWLVESGSSRSSSDVDFLFDDSLTLRNREERNVSPTKRHSRKNQDSIGIG